MEIIRILEKVEQLNYVWMGRTLARGVEDSQDFYLIQLLLYFLFSKSFFVNHLDSNSLLCGDALGIINLTKRTLTNLFVKYVFVCHFRFLISCFFQA